MNRTASNFSSLATRKMDIRDHPINNMSPRRNNIIKFDIISTQPDNIENIINCCRNDDFNLRTPPSFDSFQDVNRRVAINIQSHNVSQPVLKMQSKQTSEEDVIRRFSTIATEIIDGWEVTSMNWQVIISWNLIVNDSPSKHRFGRRNLIKPHQVRPIQMKFLRDFSKSLMRETCQA